MMLRSIVLASLFSSAAAHVVCNVCGEGLMVSAPEAIFDYPGQPALTCAGVETAGLTGLIPEEQCPHIANLITVCECAPVITERMAQEAVTPSITPSDAPSDAPSPVPSEKTSKKPASDASRMGVCVAAVVGVVVALA
ncbi:hypothetical protein MHU86_16116 [Fragilaria crotonensis]|nr:hypothetical protein MHU86_16116 [Fragilaria crotonensis]